MATVASVGGLPLDEFSKSTPPGWRNGLKDNTFRLYLEKLRLWNRMTDVAEGNKGVTIAGRLKGRAYKTALKLKIQRVREDPNNPGQLILATLTGDEAIAEPASEAVVRPADGQVLLPAQP